MLHWKSLIAPFAMAWLALSCAGKALEQSSGSSRGATSSAGAFAATGGSDAHGGTGGAGFGGMIGESGGSTGGGAGAACGQYDDEAGVTIPVRLINGTSQPIYLGSRTPGCGSGDELTVSLTGGADLISPGLCTQTCEDMRLGKAPLCPPVACPINAATTLQPGDSMLLQWSATYMQSVTLPPECRIPDGGNQCERVAGVKSGGAVHLLVASRHRHRLHTTWRRNLPSLHAEWFERLLYRRRCRLRHGAFRARRRGTRLQLRRERLWWRERRHGTRRRSDVHKLVPRSG